VQLDVVRGQLLLGGTCMDPRTTVAPSGVLGVPGVLHRQLDVALDVVPVRVGSVSWGLHGGFGVHRVRRCVFAKMVVSLNCEVARSDCICTCGGIIL